MPPVPSATPSARTAHIGLLVILAVAALLRLPALGTAPPGLHHDEAVNLWNAYCLLKTGCDAAGEHWPVFYMRAIGENRSVLFCYLLLPFQAIAGLDVGISRLLPALAGIATVALLYWTAARVFSRGTGLAAAALLAVCPTHIQLSRWAHEAAIAPLLTLLPCAAMLWAGLPLVPGRERPRVGRAVLAALIAGVCCYGYPAVRLFLPVFLLVAAGLNWRGWLNLARTRRGLLALSGLGIALAGTLGPLAYLHLTAPQEIAKRGEMTWVWSPTDAPATRAAKVLARYASHFDPQFLAWEGDTDETAWTVGFGFLPAYVVPLAGAGLLLALRRRSGGHAGRLLWAGVLLYPLGDVLNWHASPHALRSAAGLWPLLLAAGYGVADLLTLAAERRLRAMFVVGLVALVGVAAVDLGRFLPRYFAARAASRTVYFHTHVDLLRATEWLRPRVAGADAVICTTQDTGLPYLITLIALQHDPRLWQTEPREMQPVGAWERCARYGKFYFAYDSHPLEKWERLQARGSLKHVLLLIRPTEPTPPGPPDATILGPDNRPALLLYDWCGPAAPLTYTG
jgi:hypothetical protein